MRLLGSAIVLLLSVGCHSAPSAPAGAQTGSTAAVAPPESTPSAPAVQAAPGAADAHRKFGEAIAPSETIALARVLSNPDDFASRAVTVEAKVRRNCTRRGCWMELASTLDPNLPGCRVTFKDYGFFVPLDSAGSTAKVQGVVEVTRVAKEEVAHLESEGAHFATKQPDGTAREVRLVASGVELWREAS
jgi:hypothetical protein